MDNEEQIKQRLEFLESKLEKIRINIIMMSFYTDLKIIESTLHRCRLHGINIEQDLLDALKEFKEHLYSKKDIFVTAKKYLALSEKYSALRKEIYGDEDPVSDELTKEELEEMMKSYV